SAADSSAIPKRLGKYDIERELGRGGMGRVFQARDPVLGRPVALKILSESFARNPEWSDRFRQEAVLLASINHPNIATVHSLESEGPVTFITMELIPGNYGRGTPYPLDRRIGSGRGPEPGSRAREQEDAPRLRQLRASVEPGRCARGKIDARLSRSIH